MESEVVLSNESNSMIKYLINIYIQFRHNSLYQGNKTLIIFYYLELSQSPLINIKMYTFITHFKDTKKYKMYHKLLSKLDETYFLIIKDDKVIA